MSRSHRTPIVSLLGHVDHGKTTILDTLSGRKKADGESGGITQTVRIVEMSNRDVLGICDDVPGFEYTLPGLLFVDTPGHRAFRESRKRGSSMSDIAVLVVDIKNGFQPQTHEAVEYLKDTQTPFVVGVNKIDALPEWNSCESGIISNTFSDQTDRAKKRVRDSVYEIAGELSEHDLSSDFYWNVDQFTKNVGMIPMSGKTREGIPDLVSVISGLSEKYLQKKMRVNVEGQPRGQIIGTDNERGFGDVIDILLEDGVLEPKSKLHLGTRKGVQNFEAGKIFSPKNNELSKDTEFEEVNEATAAKILRVPSELAEEAIVGSSISGDRGDINSWDEEQIETVDDGIVVRAPSTDGLRAIMFELQESDVPILHGNVGSVKKIDVRRSQATETQKNRIIAAFSTEVYEKARKEARENEIEIVESDIIYELVEEVKKLREKKEQDVDPTRPCKLRVVKDGVIKKGDPAIIGVEIEKGILEKGAKISKFRNSGERDTGVVKKMEENFEDTDVAQQGDRVSISVSKLSSGRSFREDEIFYSTLSSEEAKQLENRVDMTDSEKSAFQDYVDKKSERNPFWY